jgi:ferredoxin
MGRLCGKGGGIKMNALTNVQQMSQKEALEKIKAAELLNYGIYPNNIYEILSSIIDSSKREVIVVAALDNADTDYVLLEALTCGTQKILLGISIVGYILGTHKLRLCLPEEKKELASQLNGAAQEYGIEVSAEFVNVRANKDNVILHMITLLDIFDVFEDKYQKGVYLFTGGELNKVQPDKRIADLVDLSGAKALLLGYRYHMPDIGEMTVAEANIENGVLKSLSEKECIVDYTESRLLKARRQSCGKCVFCREGLIQLHYIQKEITEGRGKKEFVELNQEIGEAMGHSTLCSLGQISAEISLTAMRNLHDEYMSHIKKRVCPAGVCTSFSNIYIDPMECTGCEECRDVCPVDCIEGKAGFIHMIDTFDCIKCGKCAAVCEDHAILETTGKVPKLPNRLTKVGRFKRR